MQLTIDQKQQILFSLGYQEESEENQELLAKEFFQVAINRIESLIEELAAIDLNLETARGDSMAVKVDDLSVNYRQHYHHLLCEGSRILGEISKLTKVDVCYDRYTQCMDVGTVTSSHCSYIVDYH